MALMFEVGIIFSAEEAGKADLLRCILINLGVPDDKISEKYQRGKAIISFYEKSPAYSRDLSLRLRALKLKCVRIFVKRIQDQDWTTRWKKYFRPFNINGYIRIVALWMKRSPVPAGYKPVYLDTTFAFGSGMHATTQMMAKLIYVKKKSLDSFLDIGTGSGILALIAWAYGCRDVWALDIDPISIKTAAVNCGLNKCVPEYLKAVKFERFKAKKQFDFVAANLLTEDLIRLQDKLIAAVKPGGFLAVSGIYFENYPLLREKFRSPGLVCETVVKKKKWYAVLFRRIS